MKMEQIPGKYENSFLYAYQDYTYNLDDRYRTPVYRCSQRRGLQCRAVTKVDEDTQTVTVLKVHNHPSQPLVVQQSRLIQRMLHLAKQTLTPTQEIFNNIEQLLVNSRIQKSERGWNMPEQKQDHYCPIPTLVELSGQLQQQDTATVATFRGHVVADDETVALIFTSDSLLELLNTSEEVYVDGTFSVTPRVPPVAQLYSIHTRFKDTGVATVFVLCEARTTALYRAIWKRIVELAPGLSTNLKFVMSDYERAAVSALKAQFPQAKIHGCWFHFNQAVLRKWGQLGLASAPGDLLSMAMSLPLAPHEEFRKCLDLIQQIADPISADYPQIQLFMAYLRTTWLPLKESVSVYGCPVRTNNLVESFHSTVPRKLGGVHPNVWIFLNNLQKMMIDQQIILRRLRTGTSVHPVRPRQDRERDQKIAIAQMDLKTGRLPLRDFLQSFGRYYRQVQYDATQQPLDDDVNIDVVGPDALDAQIREPVHQRMEPGGSDNRGDPANVRLQQLGVRAGRGRGRNRGRGRGRSTSQPAVPIGNAHDNPEAAMEPAGTNDCEGERARASTSRGPAGRVYSPATRRRHEIIAGECAELLRSLGNEDSRIPEDCSPAAEDSYQLFVDDDALLAASSEFEGLSSG